jgi:hypothetical protein
MSCIMTTRDPSLPFSDGSRDRPDVGRRNAAAGRGRGSTAQCREANSASERAASPLAAGARQLVEDDIGRHAPWVVGRVIEHGDLEDVRWLAARLGHDRFLALTADVRYSSARAARLWEGIRDVEGLFAALGIGPVETLQCTEGTLTVIVRGIALMKLAEITNRGSRKDFIDLYFAEAEPMPRMPVPFDGKQCKDSLLRECRAVVLP